MRRRLVRCSPTAVVVATVGLMAVPATAPAPGVCASLAALRLPETAIKSAGELSGPTFAPPDGSTAVRNLPAFCRVAVTKPAVLGRPDLVADFGYRGLHVMTDNGKQITQAFYDAHASVVSVPAGRGVYG